MEFLLMPDSRSSVYAPTIQNYDKLVMRDLFGRKFCGRCKSFRFAYTESVQLIIEGKGKYPDFLLCGHWPLFLISDEVVETLSAHKINGYRLHPTELLPPTNNTNEPKKYHALEVTQSVPLDFDAMNVTPTTRCGKCNQARFNKETWQFGPAIYSAPEFSNSFFAFQFFPYSVCCTHDVALLLAEKKFKGLRITDAKDNFLIKSKPCTYKMIKDNLTK